MTPQDVAAALVAVILACGAVYLAATGILDPAALTGALGAALGWLFKSAATPKPDA